MGSERAILFDAGPGARDIRPIAESLTDLPITFGPSHFHYDHLGGEYTFGRVAIVDLPGFQERVANGVFTIERMEHLGFIEGFAEPSFEVAEWLEPGEKILLGDREVTVLHTPGHTPESISLFDEKSETLFSGDFLYPGPLFAFLSNSNRREYAASAEMPLEDPAEECSGLRGTSRRVVGFARTLVLRPRGSEEYADGDRTKDDRGGGDLSVDL